MFSKKFFADFLFITAGSLLVAISFIVFILPNHLLSGGISGIAIVTNYFTGFSIPWLILIFNIPIIVGFRKELNLRFIIYTIIAVILQSLLLNYLAFMAPYTNDTLLASIYGGVIMGAGVGLIILHYGSSGGTDVISLVVKKKLGISIGTTTFIINIIIIGLAAFIFGLEPAMYTLVNIFAAGQATDLVQKGINRKRSIMIVSNHPDVIKEAIINQLHRGVTLIHGTGGFESTNKTVLFCVVNQFELAYLKELVLNLDQHAFMTISETSEVLGSFREQAFPWRRSS